MIPLFLALKMYSLNTSLTSQRKAGLEELRILAGEVIGFVDDEEKMEVIEQMENLQTLSEGIMETVSRLIKVSKTMNFNCFLFCRKNVINYIFLC